MEILGEQAEKGQFPYLVSLRLKESIESEKSFHICGGTIISPQFVISAAHCYSPSYKIEQYQIIAGVHDRSDNSTSYEVEQYIRHPKYNKTIMMFDIALIQLKTLIVFDEYVAAINIDPTFIDSGKRAIAAGWGRTDV